MSAQRQFACESCGGTFTSDWDEEEAHREAKINFSENYRTEEMARVCGDCYNAIMDHASNTGLHRKPWPRDTNDWTRIKL